MASRYCPLRHLGDTSPVGEGHPCGVPASVAGEGSEASPHAVMLEQREASRGATPLEDDTLSVRQDGVEPEGRCVASGSPVGCTTAPSGRPMLAPTEHYCNFNVKFPKTFVRHFVNFDFAATKRFDFF